MKRASLRCHRCYSGFLNRQNDSHMPRKRQSARAIGHLTPSLSQQDVFPLLWYPEESKVFASSSPRRFLTSVAKTEDSSNDVMSRVHGLLGAKYLQINELAMWEEVEEILKLLARQSTAKKNENSMEQVEYAIRLLDKLANSLPKDQVVFASMLDTDVLNRILAIWNRRMKAMGGKPLKTKSSRRPNNRTAKNRDRMLSPGAMAQRIDRYRWCSLVQPDHKTFSFVLDSASSLDSTPVFANELLEKLLQVSEATPSQVLIDTASICIVMKAWIQSGRPDKAADWFQRMQKLYERQGWEQVRPNTIAYTTVIHGWSQKEDKADKAEALLKEQLEDFQAGNESCQPDTRTFNAVLNAISKSKGGDGGNPLDRCKDILHQMQELSTNAGWQCAPDHFSLTSIIMCCTNTLGPEEAETLLAELVEKGSIAPSVVTYNVILRGYAKNGNGNGAETLLAQIKEMDGVVPDETSYNTVLYAWSQSSDPLAPQKAETLLWEMQDDTTKVLPSVVSFGSVLQCWTQHAKTSKEAAIQGEELLRQMQELNIIPNIICYNTVLNAWATIGRKFRAPEALEKASVLLQELLALYEKNSKNSSLRPTMATFRTMLYLIAESKVSNKADRAKVVVQLMEQYNVKGNKSDDKMIQRLLKPSTEPSSKP